MNPEAAELVKAVEVEHDVMIPTHRVVKVTMRRDPQDDETPMQHRFHHCVPASRNPWTIKQKGRRRRRRRI